MAKSKFTTPLPKPSPAQVKECLKYWETESQFVAQEKALNLILTEYPHNTNEQEILLKVSVLNSFYSAGLMNNRLHEMAKHILSLKIDEALLEGDGSIVDEIADITYEDGTSTNQKSFASKYCAIHQNDKFAIRDGLVCDVLRYFRDTDGFATFGDPTKCSYVKFKEIVEQFIDFYGLGKFNFRQVDRYMWVLAKRYLLKI